MLLLNEGHALQKLESFVTCLEFYAQLLGFKGQDLQNLVNALL